MAAARIWSGCLWHLMLQLLLLTSVSAAHTEEEEALPHFDYIQQGSYLLPNDHPWVPGRTTLVTFGRAGVPMQIHMGSLSGGDNSLYSKSKSCHLMFKCSSEDSGFQELSLVNSTVSQHVYQTDQFCGGGRQFKLQKLNASVHTLTLGKATNIPFEQSLKHLMEFRVRVEFSENNLSSSSLFIYSVDALMNINSELETSGDYSYRRFFLTEDAIQFLTGRTKLSAEPLLRVNFLEKKFVDLVKSAPAVISSYLAVNVALLAIEPCAALGCRPYDIVMFSTATLDKEAKAYRHLYVAEGTDFSLHTGAFFAGQQVFNVMNSLVNSSFRLALAVSMDRMVSVKGGMKVASYLVMDFKYVNKYLTKNPANKCAVSGNGTGESLTLFMDTDHNVTLDCPFVCSQKRKHCAAYREGRVCNQLIERPDSSGHQESCSGIGSVASDGGTAIFPLASHSSHLITYKFTLASLNYTYRFIVAELPLFSSWRPERLLPPVTYANLDMRVSFTCSVSHSALGYVLMSSHIQMLDVYALPTVKWRNLKPRDFAAEILGQSPNVVTESTRESQHVHSLHVILPHVTPAWRFLQLAFVCRVEVSVEDARRLLGLPHYHTETRTPLRYVGSRQALWNWGCRAAGVPAVLLLLLQLLVLAAAVGQLGLTSSICC